jgi:hypothetical protein
MTDFGPPVRLGKGPGGVLKIKRGGTGKQGNSGSAAKRFHLPPRQARPASGPVIWDPLDPVIVAYRQAHPRVEAAWRRWSPRV